MDANLQQDLGAGAVLVTGNRRLARALRENYARAREAAGRALWETPAILPWEAWLRRLWAGAAHGDPRPLLTPLQDQALWERAIDDDRGALLDPAAAAAGAADAWALMQAWRLPQMGSGGHLAPDPAAFAGWARRYARACHERGAISPARLADVLAAGLRDGHIKPPPALWLAGFDEINPQQQALLQALCDVGVRVASLAPPAYRANASRGSYADVESELTAAANWARRRLQRDAGARVAVVVPELTRRRAVVERLFADVLHPGEVLPGAAGGRAFELSLGPPLIDYPLVHAAFALLQLATGSIDANLLGSLLRSPYLVAGDSEAPARARLDARLRRRGEVHWWLADVAAAGAPLPRLAAALARLEGLRRDAAGKKTPSQWAQWMSAALTAAGWPGERGLDSREYQTRDAFFDLLDSLASLDDFLPAAGPAGAIARLRRLAAQRPFQPAGPGTGPGAGVQVLGLLEAAGQDFDGLWITGLDDATWPAPIRPSPWLPLGLQRRHGLPHASPAREADYARRITRRLLAAAPEVVVSHAALVEDAETGPSPLTVHLPAQPPPPANGDSLGELLQQRIHGARALEAWRDFQAPPVTAGAVRGGSGVFKSQAACAFQAFARYRLQARALDEPRPAGDPLERGSRVHQALEALWGELGSRAQLAGLTEPGIEALTARAAAAVVARAAQARPRSFGPGFIAAERAALRRLLADWLRFELARAPFTVEGREQKLPCTIGGLEFSLRVDRIDRLADGGRLLIDYKTGKTSKTSWEGERPDEPQLPLYAQAAPEDLAAVAYAELRPGAPRFVAVGAGNALPGIKIDEETDWQARRVVWAQVLTALARDFAAGQAKLNPKNKETCGNCDLHALCRIREVRA